MEGVQYLGNSGEMCGQLALPTVYEVCEGKHEYDCQLCSFIKKRQGLSKCLQGLEFECHQLNRWPLAMSGREQNHGILQGDRSSDEGHH